MGVRPCLSAAVAFAATSASWRSAMAVAPAIRGDQPTAQRFLGLAEASLDTLSFMPIASTDPFGGVITTDWHSAADTPNERMKLNVLILDRELRADGVKVTKIYTFTRGSYLINVAHEIVNDSKSEVGRYYSVLLNRAVARLPAIP